MAAWWLTLLRTPTQSFHLASYALERDIGHLRLVSCRFWVLPKVPNGSCKLISSHLSLPKCLFTYVSSFPAILAAPARA